MAAFKHCEDGMEVQSLLFSKDKFNKSEAESWAAKHDYKTAVDEKSDSFRMRQKPPFKFKKGSFRTIDITEGIKAVVACPKEKEYKNGGMFGKAFERLEQTSNGIPFEEDIVSSQGAMFILFPDKSKTKQDIEIAKRQLRNERDVVSIKLATAWDWDNLYKTDVYLHPEVKKLKWYEVYEEEISSQRKKGISTDDYVKNFVLPNVEKQREKMISKYGEDKLKEMKTGGTIPNNYEGKSAEQVWNEWTEKQREHFLSDHVDDYFSFHEKNSENLRRWALYCKSSYNELPNDAKGILMAHISEGQYKQGGTIEEMPEKVIDTTCSPLTSGNEIIDSILCWD